MSNLPVPVLLRFVGLMILGLLLVGYSYASVVPSFSNNIKAISVDNVYSIKNDLAILNTADDGSSTYIDLNGEFLVEINPDKDNKDEFQIKTYTVKVASVDEEGKERVSYEEKIYTNLRNCDSGKCKFTCSALVFQKKSGNIDVVCYGENKESLSSYPSLHTVQCPCSVEKYEEPKLIDNFIEKYSREYSVPEYMVRGIIETEGSDWRHCSGDMVKVGYTGEDIGLMQIYFGNIELFKTNRYDKYKFVSYDPCNLEANIQMGVALISEHYKEFGNYPLDLRIRLTFAKYNCGGTAKAINDYEQQYGEVKWDSNFQDILYSYCHSRGGNTVKYVETAWTNSQKYTHA